MTTKTKAETLPPNCRDNCPLHGEGGLLDIIDALHCTQDFHGSITLHYDGPEIGVTFEPVTGDDKATLREVVGNEMADFFEQEGIISAPLLAD